MNGKFTLEVLISEPPGSFVSLKIRLKVITARFTQLESLAVGSGPVRRRPQWVK